MTSQEAMVAEHHVADMTTAGVLEELIEINQELTDAFVELSALFNDTNPDASPNDVLVTLYKLQDRLQSQAIDPLGDIVDDEA